MKRFAFPMAFGLGALAVLWVAAAVASSHWLVLVMTALIGAVYVFAAMELRSYRASTLALQHALAKVPDKLETLNDWLVTLPAALQNPIRLRVEGEKVGLPGPAFTPYLVGLLVMLGMLGTFLGMVVTLNGAVFALEGSSSIAGMRAAFSEPIKGLGLAFGTSVAGVATSAMLGLMSSLSRRERAMAAQLLDSLIATHLRVFSLGHQRQETLKALQQQAKALPEVMQQIQALMAQMAQSSAQLNDQLLAKQERFHQEANSAYQGLAQSVDQSLRASLSQSLQLASDGIQPLVQATMGQLAEQADKLGAQLLNNSQQQLDHLSTQLSATTQQVSQTASMALAQQQDANAVMLKGVGQTLEAFSQGFDQRSQGLVDAVHSAYTLQLSQQNQAEQTRVAGWTSALQSMATELSTQWQSAGEQTLAQQQAVCEQLALTAHNITQSTQSQASQTLADINRLMQSNEHLLSARLASEAEWATQHNQRAEALAALLRHELMALREAEDARGQAAVARLDQLQTSLTTHLSTLGTALEAPITRLIETAGEAPKAAAQVIGQLRQEISLGVARDNALLEERTRILDTLNKLLDAIHHASTAQRGVIDAMVLASQESLTQTSVQFQAQVSAETGKLGEIAAQVTASAVDVASLGESFGFAVSTFSDTNQQLMAHLQRIELALDKSMSRSDEQLAYYVAQAREIIELSIGSQQDVLQALQQRQAEGAA